MAQPGRKSAASLAVVGLTTSLARLTPPPGLTAAQRSIWLATINSRPASWFGQEHIPTLRAFVEHATTVRGLSDAIAAFDPSWLAEDDGLKRFDKLLAMRARETGVVNALARSMRLTQQALYRANKAATLADQVVGGRKPWMTD